MNATQENPPALTDAEIDMARWDDGLQMIIDLARKTDLPAASILYRWKKEFEGPPIRFWRMNLSALREKEKNQDGC